MLSVEAISLIRTMLLLPQLDCSVSGSVRLDAKINPPWVHHLLFRPDQLSQSDGSVSIQLVYNSSGPGPRCRISQMQLLYKEGCRRNVDAGKRLDARVRVAPENFASTADACSLFSQQCTRALTEIFEVRTRALTLFYPVFLVLLLLGGRQICPHPDFSAEFS